jgi:hypothetical protein
VRRGAADVLDCGLAVIDNYAAGQTVMCDLAKQALPCALASASPGDFPVIEVADR